MATDEAGFCPCGCIRRRQQHLEMTAGDSHDTALRAFGSPITWRFTGGFVGRVRQSAAGLELLTRSPSQQRAEQIQQRTVAAAGRASGSVSRAAAAAAGRPAAAIREINSLSGRTPSIKASGRRSRPARPSTARCLGTRRWICRAPPPGSCSVTAWLVGVAAGDPGVLGQAELLGRERRSPATRPCRARRGVTYSTSSAPRPTRRRAGRRRPTRSPRPGPSTPRSPPACRAGCSPGLRGRYLFQGFENLRRGRESDVMSEGDA